MNKQKILIDTDPGHDDTMALMLALKSPEFDVVAVTTVCGNSTIENTTRNARFVVEFLGRSDVPVYSGCERPLARDLVQAVVHGKSGLAGLDPVNEPRLTGDAVQRMLTALKDSPGEVTIVALGPLTNVAQAILQEPDTVKLAKQLVIMGGAIDVPGNKNRVAEFNIFVDPEAADIVIRFDVPKVLVPLDACNDILLQLGDISQLTNKPLRTFLTKMLTPYIANLKKDVGVDGAMMFDVLTVFYLLEPDACTTKALNIQIETKSQITRGMTVADRRLVTDGLEPNATVVTKILPQAFVRRFIAALNR